MPLHDSNEVEYLNKKWICNIFGKQPLNEIRYYLGLDRAFYFAFLGEYTFWLIPPAIVGVFVFYNQQSGFDEDGNIIFIDKEEQFQNPSTLAYSAFISIWTTTFLEVWKRRQSALAFEWDSIDFEGKEEELLESYKARSAPVFVEQADDYDWKYPQYKSIFFRILSFLVCIGLSIIATLTMLYFLSLATVANDEWVGEDWYGFWEYAKFVPTALYMASLTFFSTVNASLANILTNLENHRTESEYINARILKIVVLQFCNYFVSPFYVAFIQQDIVKLYANIFALLGVYQVLNQVIEIGTPVSHLMFGSVIEKKKEENIKKSSNQKEVDINFLSSSNSSNSNNNSSNNSGFEGHKSSNSIENQELEDVGKLDMLLAPQEELFGEYLELFVQFGQVTLFSVVFPLAALLALINNILEIRLDAFKMLKVERRAIPRRASGIGSWLGVFEVIGYLSVMTNIALVAIIFDSTELSQKWLKNWSTSHRLILLISIEHLFIALKCFISNAIKDEPSYISFLRHSRATIAEKMANNEFELQSYYQELLKEDWKAHAFQNKVDQAKHLIEDTLEYKTNNITKSFIKNSNKITNVLAVGGGKKGNTNNNDSSGSDNGFGNLSESLLMSFFMDSEQRRIKAEKGYTFLRRKIHTQNKQKSNKFSEGAQLLNLGIFIFAVIYLFTKEARNNNIE